MGEQLENQLFTNKTVNMSSHQIVRRRLNSLKNITEQLKNSTTSGPYNFSHIKSLFSNLKHISQIPTQQIIKHEETDHYPQAFTQQSQQITTEKTFEEQEYRPLFQESVRKKQNKTFNKSFQESQIIDLRQQNLKLQEKLAVLREQLYQLKQKSERKVQQKQSSKLPFFSLRQTLQAFICRYEISEENYPKIEYTQYEVELKLDRLILIRKQKNSLQQLDLSTLINVKYIDSHHILFMFEEFVQSEYLNLQSKDRPRSELTNLFVKFSSEQVLHKWDLSLFMNFNNVNSLHQQKLFQPYFRRLVEERKVLREKNDLTEIRQSKQLNDKKEKDLLKILIKRRQEYLEIRTLIQEKLGHNKLQNQNDVENQQYQKEPLFRRHPDIPEPLTLLNGTDRVSISSSQKSKKKNNNKYWQQSQYNSMPPSIIQQINQVQQSMQRSHPQNESKMNYSPSFSGLATIQQKTFRQESETFPFGQIPYQTQNNFKPFPSNVSSTRAKQSSINISKANKNLSDWPDNRLKSLSKSKQLQNKVSAAKQSLQNGYFATKYSKDGFYPHQKKIFLSLDCKKLCWSEKDKEPDYKGIPLEVITKIEYAAVGEGIKKHVKSPQPKYYCVIEYFTGEYKKKTIELGSGNYQQIKKFTQQLQLTVNNQRGIPLGGIVEN